jgi:hypothetical protein
MKKPSVLTIGLVILLLTVVLAAPALAGSGTVTVNLKSSTNTGLAGGVVNYYDGGWKLLGTTDSSGTVSGVVPKYTDMEIRYAGGRYYFGYVEPSTNPTLTINTVQVTVKLETCGGTPLVGEAKYYYGGWTTIGNTPATIELLPYSGLGPGQGSYDFQVIYDGRTSATIRQDISVNPVIVFKTTKVNFLTSDTVYWYNGGWQLFTSPKEVIGGLGKWADFKFGDTHNPTIRLDINGCELSGYPVTVKLLDSKGVGLEGGFAEYFHSSTSWQPIGTTGSDGTVFALLPKKPSQIKLTYEWVTNRNYQDITVNPVVTFNTIDVLTTLKTCGGIGLEGGVAEYLSSYWRPIGTTDTNGEIHKEMLPANLQFKMTYAYGTDRFYQDTGTDPSVDFTTTKVTLNYPGTITYQSGYWRPFTSPMEMMAGTYLFKFEGAGPTVRQYLTISGCDMGGTVALIKLLDSYGNGLSGGTAEWYRTSQPSMWISLPGSTDTNGNLFALVPATGPKFKLTYAENIGYEQHNLLTDPNVVFQTGRVVSDSGTCTHWGNGQTVTWVPFVNGMELLPGLKHFKGNDGTAWWEDDTIVAGTENHVR